MSRFSSAGHLASWAGMCPGNNESANKRFSGKTRKGSKWLRTALVEVAQAAARTKGTYLAAQYARIKAATATVRRSLPLLTRSWSSPITSCNVNSLTANWAATTSSSANKRTPINDGWSSNSSAWATTSRLRRNQPPNRRPWGDFHFRSRPRQTHANLVGPGRRAYETAKAMIGRLRLR
jgi:hypothetical protein